MFINNTKDFDQHFLIDNKIINKFIDTCNITIYDDIVEVGPGKCTLSNIIAPKCKHLTLIERDTRLKSFINVLVSKCDNVSVIYNNVLDEYIPACDKIISSLPYSITEPFVEKLLRCSFKECILLVGDRFAKSIYSKEINKLSLLCNSFFNIEYIISVPKESFNPMPRVESAIIKLTKKSKDSLKDDFIMFMFREMFYNRSRKLKNNLMESLINYSNVFDKVLTKKESKSIILEFNISNNILNKEMEQLSNEEYVIIYNALSNYLQKNN